MTPVPDNRPQKQTQDSHTSAQMGDKHQNHRTQMRCAVFAVLGVFGFVASGNLIAADSFDEKRKQIAGAVETQTEAVILDLLKSGLEEGKPTQAAAEAQKWLRQNIPGDNELLFHAGRAAELSGDARSAAALYQQYLKVADPASANASTAVVAVHSLLIDQLKDTSSAFSFGRSIGDRLAVNPTARQFDQWYLNEAMRRKDPVAVANRLHALIKAGISDELRVVYYDQYYRWLLEQVDNYCERPGMVAHTEELVAAYKQLASAMTFNEELALRMDWAVSVRDYNLARIAEEEVPPPVAQAKALLEKYPSYALWVQTGWAGGGNGQYYRNDPAKYWPYEVDAKMGPILAAIPKLSPIQLAGLLESWRDRYYSDNTVRPLKVKAVRDYVLANPQLMNSKTGVLPMDKPWNEMTPEEARELAPKIQNNSSPDASYVRAMAAAGDEKELDKAMDTLMRSELWRLSKSELSGRTADQLWHWAGRPGDSAKRDQEIAKTKAFAAQIDASALKKESPAAQRIGEFRKLWADYRSPQPKIPAVYERLKAVLLITPEVIPELLNDKSVEAQLLARNAMAQGISGTDPVWTELEAANRVNVSSYAPGFTYLAKRHAGGDLATLKQRYPLKCVPHPFEAAMRKAVADGVAQNKLESWQLIAWINMQYPEDNEEQVKVIQSVLRSPSWNQMSFEARYAARSWFVREVMTPAQVALVDAADPALFCKDLLAIKKDQETKKEKKKKEREANKNPDVAAAAGEEAKLEAKEDTETALNALRSAVEGVRKSPVRIIVPDEAFENLALLSPAVFEDAGVQDLLLQIIDDLKSAPVPANFGYRLLDAVVKNPDPKTLHRAAPFIWEHVNRHVRTFPQVKALTQSLVESEPSAASAMASLGLSAIARHRGHTYYDREADVPLFKSIRGNAAMKMGLIVIPVAKNNPSYPVYQSQGDWITGNEESAWDLLDENWDAFMPVYRELSLPYVKWALERVIYSRDEIRQESLIKSLLEWSGETGSPLQPVEKAEIELAYGDIAMQRGQLRQAHEIYARTEKNEAYKDLAIKHRATLKRASAERIARDFSGALQTLNQLELEQVSELWTEIRYARAEVNFDMEEFDDAKDDIESILAREPNHPDAKILLGKVQLKSQKLMEATEVELGSVSGQKSLVPGERLKVTLNDPTLAVSGAGSEIEVVVWATSGDKETFFLRQFGDQKTKFRGEVETELGEPSPGDKKLQVIGDDEIFYAYSERFRARMNNLPEKRGGPITVASDALLMASARKLLNESEQRVMDMQKLIEELEARGSRDAERIAKARIAAESLDAVARAERDESDIEADFQRSIATIVKPGNPINVRVIDPDRSRTGDIDELAVSVSSSSGDTVSRVVLKETGTHTGWFEGRITTTGAQAMAFAEDSETGRNPNMVISPNADTYPAWRPLAVKDKTPAFTVDLNDNVELGELTIKAAEEGAKLKSFSLQTGMNGGGMTTVAVYPKNQVAIQNPWQPSVIIMNDTDRLHTTDERSVYDIDEIREHMARGWITQTYAAGVAENVAGPSEAMNEAIPAKVKWLRQNRHHNSHVIYRFRGYFYEPEEVTRRFKVQLGNYKVPENTHPSVAHPPQFMLAVNGRPITDQEKPDRLEGEVRLRSGLHHFEIWATGWDCTIGFGRSIKLLANLEDEETLADCPDSFFDPTTFPEGVMDHRNSPATITANEDGTEFKVKFADGSRGRLLKLEFHSQEGPVPALNKLALTKPEGDAVLPVAEDFAVLNKNETLEILTGDKIFVRYVDDRFVTKNKERLERSLNVAFSDARVEFADMEPRWSQKHGEERPYYERLLRFPYDDALALAVHDADMDVSEEPDTVTVSFSSGAGSTLKVVATETGDSTGVFKAVVVPVSGPATEANQIQVPEGGTLTAIYVDTENNRPGVPIERSGTISHAKFEVPEFRVAHASVEFRERDIEAGWNNSRWEVTSDLLSASDAPEEGLSLVHGRMAYFDLRAPQLALRNSSKVTVFVQTEAGRKAAAAEVAEDAGATVEEAPAFDINVPGTKALKGVLPSSWQGRDWFNLRDWQSPNYVGGGVNWSSIQPGQDTDRFLFSVPLVADVLPEVGYLDEEEIDELRDQIETSRSASRILEQVQGGLVVRPGDKIHFGFRFDDGEGKEQWLTTSAKVITHPLFEIMDSDFRETVDSIYAGETLHLRVTDLGADLTDESDTVSVLLQSKSGAKARVNLTETDPHSGVFTGGYSLSYAEQPGELPEDYDVRRSGFPVIYGDTVASRYTDANDIKTPISFVTISKGADGTIQPFSKQYDDPAVATQTQFSLAEAYLEVAKRRRKLGDTETAAIEYAQAKQLLANAIDQFRDPETRAHAEYLLGNLTMEEADTTEELELREDRYRAALSRFMTVTGSYSETLHASKAQFKIATVYEKLREPDIAAQEYVKLAYKYPDSEFLATAMARLGTHFVKKASEYEQQAKVLLEKVDDKDAQFDGEALQKLAHREYLKTAQIFGRLQQRFPDNEMAGAAGLRAGQSYMRANAISDALEAFTRVINEEGYDGKTVRSQAMYWAARCYQDQNQQMPAYSMYKRLTYDFPESEWAAYARGQLSQDNMIKLEEQLELERLEAGQ